MPIKQRHDFPQCALAGLGATRRIKARKHPQEIIPRFVRFDFALTQALHAIHEGVPSGYRNAKLALYCLLIERSVVRHFHGTAAAGYGNSQSVIAYDTNAGELRCRCECAVACGREQNVRIAHVISLEGSTLTCSGQGPDLTSAF